jgi:hypothetical protein
MYVLLINCIITGFFFNRLANKHNRSGANLVILGVFLFIGSILVTPFLLFDYFDLRFRKLNVVSFFLLKYSLGIVSTTILYFVLNKIYKKKPIRFDNDILDN